MSTDAIVMMVVAMLVLWGGLALAVLNISRSGGTAAGDGGAEPPTHETYGGRRDL
ncbi:methionine/alanine import family NSS transporter small subunit [Nocardioides sp. IC4_145]|uniref:methionine/alanine import family NSS transporter small subunit n=1 Tax=Nocardioides sp. IC4_145 TaxID=2714037 RepID=UPI001408452D|nr:methionine/alanine import family NSS transporter small subunit [Nocardioides sp. IC4_145]NHC23327.1 methionine/alanine import family NSS transporter small subunit [Nocardioides sp. IC4_145]